VHACERKLGFARPGGPVIAADKVEPHLAASVPRAACPTIDYPRIAACHHALPCGESVGIGPYGVMPACFESRGSGLNAGF